MASDRKNLIYYDDTGETWLVREMAAYLVNLGFTVYDEATHEGVPDLPPGFRMRRVNMVHVNAVTGESRRVSFPVGMVDNEVYTGAKKVKRVTPGIDASGAEGSVEFLYRISSTRGEIRTFLTRTDPGATKLVGQEYITAVTPTS